MYVVGRSLLRRKVALSKFEDIEASLTSLIQAINSVNERVLEIKKETAESIRDVVRRAERNSNFSSFYGELRMEVNKAALEVNRLSLEFEKLKVEKVRKSFSEKIKALPWKSESPQGKSESTPPSPAQEAKNASKLDVKVGEKVFNLTDDTGIQEWKKYVEQNVNLIRRSFRSSPLSPICPNSALLSSESGVSTSLTTGTTRFLANQRREQENQLNKDHETTQTHFEPTEEKEGKRYDWLFQSSIFQNEGPVKVIQGVKTVDRCGKPHRRIFVPGTGWTSAKKLAHEKNQGKVIVEPETNHIAF